jgi:hypothetical protein
LILSLRANSKAATGRGATRDADRYAIGSPTSAPPGGARLSQSFAGRSPGPVRSTEMRAGGFAGSIVNGTTAVYEPGSILPRPIVIVAPSAVDAVIWTSAPDFHRAFWIDTGVSSVTTVSVFPLSAVYDANGRDARSRIASAVSRSVAGLATPTVPGAGLAASAFISSSVGARYWRRARIVAPDGFSFTLIVRMPPSHVVFVV